MTNFFLFQKVKMSYKVKCIILVCPNSKACPTRTLKHLTFLLNPIIANPYLKNQIEKLSRKEDPQLLYRHSTKITLKSPPYDELTATWRVGWKAIAEMPESLCNKGHKVHFLQVRYTWRRYMLMNISIFTKHEVYKTLAHSLNIVTSSALKTLKTATKDLNEYHQCRKVFHNFLGR